MAGVPNTAEETTGGLGIKLWEVSPAKLGILLKFTLVVGEAINAVADAPEGVVEHLQYYTIAVQVNSH